MAMTKSCCWHVNICKYL